MRCTLGIALLSGLVLIAGEGRARADLPAHVGYVESSRYPIRVHYLDESVATRAASVLSLAEWTWEQEVEGMGFPAPMTEDASGNQFEGLWVFLTDTGGSGHAQPVSDIPDTPWTDCTTWVMLPDDLPDEYWPVYVAHESNHALQMAADCTEAFFAYENTTVAVTVVLFPDDALWTTYFLPAFQGDPQQGLDCTFFGDALRQYYHYGAALFQVFLEEWIGDDDGTLMARFWQAARQEGTVTTGGYVPTASVPNEPDLLDAIDTVLQQEGSCLDEAFVEFARWRWFVGSRDDGEHFAAGDQWTGSEVRVAKDLEAADLPVEDDTVDDPPRDYGTVYLRLDLDGIQSPQGVVFDFDGAPGVDWRVEALRVAADGSATVEPVTLDADGSGERSLGALGDTQDLVFIVSALGGADHDADNPPCTTAHDFSYSLRLEDLDTVPSIASVSPARVTPGESAGLVVQGAGFLPGVEAGLSCEGVTVFSTQRIDDGSLNLVVSVDADAELGACDLTVTNANGHAVTLTGAVEVVSAGGGAGCGCRQTTPGAGGGLPWLLLAFGLLWRRRRVYRGRPR